MAAERRQQHFLQTRFNLYLALRETVCPTEESYQAWCAERAELFLAVTLPSVLQQTNQDLDWLVYFDVERNAAVDRVLEALEPHPRIHPIFYDGRGRHPTELIGRARLGVAARTDEGTEVVVTTKLDSDDGLHQDYVEVIGARARRLALTDIASGVALNCTFGALMVGGRFFAFPYDHNPYLALVEVVGTPMRTAMTIQHHQVHRRVPVTQVIHGQPLWLQVVHSRNAFNKARVGLLELAESPALGAMFGLTPAALAALAELGGATGEGR